MKTICVGLLAMVSGCWIVAGTEDFEPEGGSTSSDGGGGTGAGGTNAGGAGAGGGAPGGGGLGAGGGNGGACTGCSDQAPDCVGGTCVCVAANGVACGDGEVCEADGCRCGSAPPNPEGPKCSGTYPLCTGERCICTGGSCTNGFVCDDGVAGGSECVCDTGASCGLGTCFDDGNGAKCDCTGTGLYCDFGQTCDTDDDSCTCAGGSCPS